MNTKNLKDHFKVDWGNIPRFPRRLKKQMKKQNRYTTKSEYLEDYKERISLIKCNSD
jgi:hypothetical protein